MREPDEPAPPARSLADIEHELVNALAAILGFSQVIRRDPAMPEDLRQNADLLVQEATRTRRLVRELLDVTGGQAPGPPSAADEALIDSERGREGRPVETVARPAILVLDDEPSIRLYLEKALELLGYEPDMTSHGPDAVERAAVGDHAALLFDHQMGGMSGAQAFEAVMAVRPDLAARCILMSADVLDPELEALAATHPVTLLAKPFDLDTLDRTICAVMDATDQPRG